MKYRWRLIAIAIPCALTLALTALHRQLGGLAPSPPVTVPGLPEIRSQEGPPKNAEPIILLPSRDVAADRPVAEPIGSSPNYQSDGDGVEPFLPLARETSDSSAKARRR
ncbi:MAG TPA: hypothetical protein VIY86_02735 [Pirellulaceae bacterium]